MVKFFQAAVFFRVGNISIICMTCWISVTPFIATPAEKHIQLWPVRDTSPRLLLLPLEFSRRSEHLVCLTVGYGRPLVSLNATMLLPIYSIDIDFVTNCYIPFILNQSNSGFPIHSLRESRVARRDSTSELLRSRIGAAGIRNSGTGGSTSMSGHSE